jgi:PadR family transcriptional regulator PadR
MGARNAHTCELSGHSPSCDGTPERVRRLRARFIFAIVKDMKTGSLGTLELMLLLALLRLEPDAYGVSIAGELETVTGRAVSLGAVYATLERLNTKGLVTAEVGEPTAQRGGRAKRFFKVTPRGLTAVKETQRALAALTRGIPKLRGEMA